MKHVRHLVVLCIMTAWLLDTHAFETDTHELVLTRGGANRSVLQIDLRVLRDLGLEKSITDTAQTFPDASRDERTIRELIEIGSRFEDSIYPTVRPSRHFYNPLTGRGMDEGNFRNQTTSPDWALAPRGSISQQEFSYGDARAYLFDALTKPDEVDRKRAFGLTFQTLGHVIHHLQDMAQPQHVRNDVHCSVPVICWAAGLEHAPSFFERWTNRSEIRNVIEQRDTNPTSVGYDITGGAFTSVFNSPRKFWSTEPVGAVTPAGKGIAEFTSRNFLSAGTNFDNLLRPALPAFDPTKKSEPTVAELCNANLNPPCPPSMTALPDARVTFYETTGRDYFLDTPFTNLRASTESIFDEQLRVQGEQPVFALNRFNFDEAYKHLIPRAVAYSAGLINYFFRGKLDFKKDDLDSTKFRIVNLGPEAMNGRFALYYDAIDGNRYPVTVDPADVNRDPEFPKAWRLTIATLNPDVPNTNLSAPISFIAPANDGSPLSPKVANEYMLVFNGNMGEEKEDKDSGVIGAVVAKALKAEINGALYVKVQRNNFTQAVLKVDKSGTRYLQPGEFNPLESFDPNGSVINRSNWQAAWYKQVEFKPLPFGGNDYTVLSFSVPNRFTGHASYVRDANGNLVRRLRPISWIARNTPNGDFEFGFDIISFENQSSVQYTRRFMQDGQMKTEQGMAPWPLFRAPLLSNRAGVVYSMPAISSDGLRVGGFIEGLNIVDQSVAGVSEFRREMVEHVVTLTPGAIPSAALQSTSRQSHSHSKQWNEPTQQITNEFVETFTSCDGKLSSGFSREFRSKSLRHIQHMTRTLHGVGASVTGDSKFVEYVGDQRIRIGQDIEENAYQAGCVNGIDNSIRYAGRGDREALATTVTSITGLDRTEATDNNGGYNSNPHDMRAPYNLINSLPPWIPKSVQRGRSLELIQALGDKAVNAIYNEINYGAGTSGLQFRGEMTNFKSVADVSPVGEIFFASEDGKKIVHEPLQGGIQKIVLPPDVVRILGAIWL